MPNHEGSFYLDRLQEFHNELIESELISPMREGSESNSSTTDPMRDHLLSPEFQPQTWRHKEPDHRRSSPAPPSSNRDEHVGTHAKFGYQSGAMSPIASSKKMDEELNASEYIPTAPTSHLSRRAHKETRIGQRQRLDQSSMMTSTLRPIGSGSILMESSQWGAPSHLTSSQFGSGGNRLNLNSPSLIDLMNKASCVKMWTILSIAPVTLIWMCFLY